MRRYMTVTVFLPGDHTARFSDTATALRFARAESIGATVEVKNKTGLIAQFRDGKATPEFAHLDQP